MLDKYNVISRVTTRKEKRINAKRYSQKINWNEIKFQILSPLPKKKKKKQKMRSKGTEVKGANREQ